MFTLLRRLRARLKYRHYERDLVQEIEVHRDLAQQDLQARGLSTADARTAASKALGNTTYMREETRRVRLGRLGCVLDQLRADLVDGARSLKRSPAFTLVAVCVLALGIGLNAAIFSVVKAVFLPDSPVDSPSTFVYINADKPIALREFRAATETTLAGFASHGRPNETLMVADRRAARRFLERVSANYFDVLGLQPAVGRTFSPAEGDVSNPAKAIVISHNLWVDLFAADPDVVGRPTRIGADTFTVIGVMPERFAGLSAPWRPTDAWVTEVQALGTSDPKILKVVTEFSRGLVARLQAGVSVRQVVAAGSTVTPVRVLVSTDAPIAFAEDGVGQFILMIASTVMAVGLMVLLIAATNITGIIAARSVSRQREFAVRQALGAGGWRIIQQRLLESVLLAGGGGVVGLGIAWICVHLYRAYSPVELVFDAPLDWQVVAYTALVCMGAGVLMGLSPALRARRPELLTALGGGVGAGLPKRHRRRLQYGVLVPQIMLSIVLLIVGGVYGSTLLRMQFPDPGYRVEDVTTATFTLTDGSSTGRVSPADYPDKKRLFHSQLLDRLRQTPGVEGAALSSRVPSDHMPIIYTRWISDAAVSGLTGVPAEGNGVSDGYFATLGIPLLRGRDFDSTDVVGSPPVAIISESFARALWPNEDPIGRSYIRLNHDGSRGGQGANARRVIGVVRDTRSPMQTGHERPSYFTPLSQNESLFPGLPVFLNVAGPPAAVAQAIHAAIGTEPLAHVLALHSMEEMIGRELYPFRAAAWLFGVAGIAGIMLAALGLYGVMSHSVAQQQREFGIRATLGATGRDLSKLVLAGGVRVALFAGIPGLIAAFLTLRAASRWVQMAPVIEPWSIAGILGLIVAVVLSACYIPARRAARVNPADTLRAE